MQNRSRLSVLLLFSTLCGLTGSLAQASLRVGVTQPLVQEWVTTIGGEHVTVVLLRPETQAPACDLIFLHGLDLDAWFDERNAAAPTFLLTDGLPLLKIGEPFHRELPPPNTDVDKLPSCCKAAAQAENNNWSDWIADIAEKLPDLSPMEAVDPYVWLDVHNAQSIFVAINDILAEHNPENGSFYDEQADAYLQQLQNLDTWIRAELRNIPVTNRLLITAGDQFRYFARAHGLIAPIHFPITQAPEAQLSQITLLATFAEDSADEASRLRLTALNEALGLAAPARLITAPNHDFATYEQMMRYNVKVIVNALTGNKIEH